ncbi:MAG TPA: vitamin K epoxide reductase family protein [Longimicrobiaceae bacterium]
MALVLLALIGVFVAGYLTLHRFGYIGTLQCSVVGGCETVQASAYAFFPPRTVVQWGIPVALLGLIGYLTLFVVGLLGLQPRYVGSRTIARLLVLLSGGGLLFSFWLTYVEAVVLRAWCQWCVVSAVLITLIFLLSLLGLLRGPRRSPTN